MNTPTIINDLVKSAHLNAIDKDFWTVDQNIGNKIALIHSELSEFFEGYRRDTGFQPDEHCKEFTNMSIELADTVIRIFDLAGWLDLPLGDAILAKMEYNKTRPKLHGKKF
jgi:NTP pyrophosphatase (non-canonical NTP hydrolase)